MATTTLPPASTLPTLPFESQTAILGALFEPSPALCNTVIPLLQIHHQSYSSLVASIHSHLLALRTSEPNILLEILSSHPRRGAPKVDSAQSAAEQAQLQGDRVEELRALNGEYEAKFPGLRFVVFVNGRGRGEIVEVMRERIQRGDWEAERDGAIQAMCDIAVDRAAKLGGV
ncbi:hypothetical protein Q7P37_001846 [Cladosporium fusiforme]